MSRKYYVHEIGRSLTVKELRERLTYHKTMVKHYCSAGSAQYRAQKKMIKEIKKVLD
jgi:hypothetical protein